MLHHSSVRFYVIVVPSTINPEGKSLLIYYNRCHFAEKECLIFEINQRKSCCILSNYQLLLVAFGSRLVDFNAGKIHLIQFYQSNNSGAIDVKMDESFLEEKSSFKMIGLYFSSKLDWVSCIFSTVKTASKKTRALFRSMKFLSLKVSLYLCRSIVRPRMKYCCHVSADALGCYFDMLDKLQKRACRTVGPTLVTSLELLVHRRNVARLSLFYRYYICRYSPELAELVPLPCSCGKSSRCSERFLFFFTISRCYENVSVNSFFPRLARPWNSLPVEWFPLTYDLNSFKCGVNWRLLSLGSF